MSEHITATYIKNGATFASGTEAYADKNSQYSPEIAQQIADCYAQMLEDEVLLEPIMYTWNQDTFTLTIVKHVSSLRAYNNALTFEPATAVQSVASGWIFIPA
jgi:hypothetical protein